MRTVTNEHGVECIESSTGRYFCHIYAERQRDSKRVRVDYSRQDFETYYDQATMEEVINDTVWVPVVCLDCDHYNDGEWGEFGGLLAGPLCKVNLRFPTKKGTCKRKR